MLPTIQALRALAAYLVVMLHLSSLAVMVGVSDRLFEFGNSGVDLFFVISGFIMVFSAGRSVADPWGFFAGRISRVVPIYWLITVIVFIVAVLAPSLLQATHCDPIELLKSLLFIPFRKENGLIQPIVFVGWTLNYEMFFYVLFTISLLLRNRTAGLSLNFVTLIGLVTLYPLIRPDRLEARFFTSPILLEFVFGMVLGVIFPFLSESIRWPWLRVVLAAFALGAMFWARLIWPEADRSLVFGVPAFFVVLCALSLDRAGVGIRSELLLKLGNASYSIYLTHFFVTQATVKLAQRLQLESVLALGLCYVAALVGVGAAGILVWSRIEKPMALAVRERFEALRLAVLTQAKSSLHLARDR